jgi:hypothetical protein
LENPIPRMSEIACLLQFHSLRNRRMLNVAMPKSRIGKKILRKPSASNRDRRDKNEETAAAELALKAYVLKSNPDILADMTEGDRVMQEIVDMVDLTEAPEDAVASLVIDLLHYCERKKIDWTEDVMSRAWDHCRNERAYEAQGQ